MRTSIILSILALASTALSAPLPGGEHGHKDCKVRHGARKTVSVIETIYKTAEGPAATVTYSPEVAAAPAQPTPPPVAEKKPVVVEKKPEEKKEEKKPEPVAQQQPAPVTVDETPKKVEEEKAVEVDRKTATDKVTGSTSGSYSRTGEATFYDPDHGACGTVNNGSEMVAAISMEVFDLTTPGGSTGNPNKNTMCGKKIRCSVNGGKEIIVTLVDRCVGCAAGDLDLSPAAFDASGAKRIDGRLPVRWDFV